MQTKVWRILRYMGLKPANESLVAGGLFSVDIALKYADEDVAVEVCGPTHFVVPAAALEEGGVGGVEVGPVESSPDQRFSEALVVGAAIAAAGALATAAAAGGGVDADAFYLVGSDRGGGGVLQLGGGTWLRARLLEALGWKVAHLPFHVWVVEPKSDLGEQLLTTMLDHAVGSSDGSGGGGSSGGRSKTRGGEEEASGGDTEDEGGATPKGRRIDPAKYAARKVLRANRRYVQQRAEARQQKEQRQASRRDGAKSLTTVLGAMDRAADGDGGGGVGSSGFDQLSDGDDLYLDPDLLGSLPSDLDVAE
jgi:hypothetical protein